jgi:hypothetical protein
MTPFGSISLVLQRFVHKSVHKFRVATARHSAARRADREPNLRTRRIIDLTGGLFTPPVV